MPIVLHKETGRIVREGMGGFLNPPGHPAHTLSVETELNRRAENRARMSLEAALECSWLADSTKAQARMALDKWRLQEQPPLHAPEVKQWIWQVLGYFRHCYNDTPADPEGWSAGRLTIDATRSPMEHPERSAGVNLIRRFYPDYTPTAEDFASAYWGRDHREDAKSTESDDRCILCGGECDSDDPDYRVCSECDAYRLCDTCGEETLIEELDENHNCPECAGKGA